MRGRVWGKCGVKFGRYIILKNHILINPDLSIHKSLRVFMCYVRGFY